MPDLPVTRRQFLGSAAAVAATPLGASDPFGPSPSAAPPHFPAAFAPEPLPPGVGKQLGMARFRDLTMSSGQFSANSRWRIRFRNGWCEGYELPSGRRIAFGTLNDPGWELHHWLPTTDGRLTVVEHQEAKVYRVRRYDLLTGTADPPIPVKGGRVSAVSADGRVAVIETDGKEPGSRGVELGTGRTAWEWADVEPLFTLEPTGRLVVAGRYHPEQEDVVEICLLDAAMGRMTRLAWPEGRCFFPAQQPLWYAAGGHRVTAEVAQHGLDRPLTRVITWDANSGRVVGSFPLGTEERLIGPTADGHGLFAVDGEDLQLVIRATSDGRIVRRLPVFDVDTYAPGVTPDGRTLLLHRRERGPKSPAFSTDNEMIRLIDAESGLLLPQSPDPPGPLTRIWFPATATAATAFRTKVGHLDYTFWDVPAARGRRVVDPTERNEAKQRDELEPANLVSPDGRQTLRPDGSRLTVVSTTTGRTVASTSQPPVAAGRWFWLDAATVGVFSSDGLHVWKPDVGTVRVLPLNLPGKRPLVWRWRAAADGKRVGFQFFPDLAALVFRVGWVEVERGEVVIAADPHAGRGVGLAGSADGGRVAVGLDRPKWAERRTPDADWIAVHDRDGRRWLVNTPQAAPPFDLTGCGRTLAVRASGESTDDDTPAPGPALELWEVVSGQRRRRYPVDTLPDDLRCSPCGRWVGTVRADQPLYLWDVYGEVSDPQREPTRTELPQLWADLGSVNGEVAFRAVRTLVQHPAAAVELLGARLKPVQAPKADWVEERIEKLGHRDFRTRDAAERELSAVADVVADELRKAAEFAETEEAGERLERLLARANGKPLDVVRTTRAVEVLEYAGESTRELLGRLASGAPTALLTREATAAVRRKVSAK